MRLENINVEKQPNLSTHYCYKNIEDWYNDMPFKEALLQDYAERHNLNYYIQYTISDRTSDYPFITNILVYNA